MFQLGPLSQMEPSRTIKSGGTPWNMGAKVGEEVGAMMSRGIEVSGRDEGNLEERLSGSTGAC